MMTSSTAVNSGSLNAPGTPTSIGVAPQPHPNKPLFPCAAAIVRILKLQHLNICVEILTKTTSQYLKLLFA